VDAGDKDDMEGMIVLPPVDSHSQMSLRRKIVLDKLSRVLPDVFSHIGVLSVMDIRADIRSLVHTFALTSKNILLKPDEWILMAVVLLYMLGIRSQDLRDAMKEESFISYLQHSRPFTTLRNSSDLEHITCRAIAPFS